MIYRPRSVSLSELQHDSDVLRALIREIACKDSNVINEGILDFIKGLISSFFEGASNAFDSSFSKGSGVSIPADEVKNIVTPGEKFSPKENPKHQVYAVLLMLRTVNFRTGSTAQDFHIEPIEQKIDQYIKDITDIKNGTSEEIKKLNDASKQVNTANFTQYAKEMKEIYNRQAGEKYKEIINNISREMGSLKSSLTSVEFPGDIGKDWYTKIMEIGKSINPPANGNLTKDLMVSLLQAVKKLDSMKLSDNASKIIESDPVKSLLNDENEKDAISITINAVRTEIGRYNLPAYKQRLEKLVPKLIQLDKIMGESGAAIDQSIKSKDPKEAGKDGGDSKPIASPIMSHYKRAGRTISESVLRSVIREIIDRDL